MDKRTRLERSKGSHMNAMQQYVTKARAANHLAILASRAGRQDVAAICRRRRVEHMRHARYLARLFQPATA